MYVFQQMNGYSFTNKAYLTNHSRRPSRRVEVSPPPSPDIHRNLLSYGTQRYATYTHPGPRQLHRMGTMLDHTMNSDSFQRYAFSEVPCIRRPQASTSTMGSFRGTPHRQTAAQPVFANAAFQQNGDFGSRWSQSHSIVKQDKQMVQSKQMMLGSNQHDEGLAWLAKVRRDGQKLNRLNSYPPSVISMEVDFGRQVEGEPPIQQIQTQSVTTL